MKLRVIAFPLSLILLWSISTQCLAQLLQVKTNRNAIVKEYPTGESAQRTNLPPGTVVLKVAEVSLYYSIQLANGQVGWSYKGNFEILSNVPPAPVTKETLMARSDVLQIAVIDVDVGDATLIFCPQEGTRRDLILIDTGESDDCARIEELIKNAGFTTSGKCLSRLIIILLDELGYVPFSKAGAELLFDVVSRAYERTSLIVTTNLPFEQWTEVLGSKRFTGALLHRLTHRVHILEANGQSFRLTDAKRRLKRK